MKNRLLWWKEINQFIINKDRCNVSIEKTLKFEWKLELLNIKLLVKIVSPKHPTSIIQVDSHVINLPVFNRRRFALIMLFPMCTNDKNLYSCLSIDEWVCRNVCVWECVWQNAHKFYFYSPEGCCKIFYNTTNVTLVIQHPTKTKTKNDWLLKNGKNSKNQISDPNILMGIDAINH